MKQSLKDATIKIKDGGSNSITVKIGDGDVTWDETRNITYEMDKGKLDTVREGDDVPLDVNLSFNWEWVKSESPNPATPYEAIKRVGAAAEWESTSADDCEVYCCDLEITLAPKCSNGTKGEVILLSEFRYEKFGFSLKNGQITCPGKCNVTEATYTRTSISS